MVTLALPFDGNAEEESQESAPQPNPKEATEERASDVQLGLIRRYMEDDRVSEQDLSAELQRRFGVDATQDLSKWQAATLLSEIQQRERFQQEQSTENLTD